MNIDNYIGKGKTGLKNMGNSCYVNALLQILSHTYEMNDFLNTDYRNKLNHCIDSKLLVSWDELRKLMWSENCTISPGAFMAHISEVSTIKKMELFSGMAQNDLPEFLLFVFDTFHNALKREVDMKIEGDVKNTRDKIAKSCYDMMIKEYSSNFSEILKLFYGIHVSTITMNPNVEYSDSDILSIRAEAYMIISLPIPNKQNSAAPVHLFDCMDLYCESEYLKGDNAWYNENTKQKQDVYKRLRFWSLPQIMIIDLKRFEFNYKTMTFKKNKTNVQIPLTNVNFSKFVDGYNKEDYIYDLYGICTHHGTSDFGHYTSTVRLADLKWYNFDDESVKEIKSLNNDAVKGTELMGNTPYCLFYRKIQKL